MRMRRASRSISRNDRALPSVRGAPQPRAYRRRDSVRRALRFRRACRRCRARRSRRGPRRSIRPRSARRPHAERRVSAPANAPAASASSTPSMRIKRRPLCGRTCVSRIADELLFAFAAQHCTRGKERATRAGRVALELSAKAENAGDPAYLNLRHPAADRPLNLRPPLRYPECRRRRVLRRSRERSCAARARRGRCGR